MLHCILATKNRNVINFKIILRLYFLIILFGSKMVDCLLLSYAQTPSSFTLICWSVSSVSAVFLIASKLCKVIDWVTDWRTGPRNLSVQAAAVVNNHWRLYSLFASAYQQNASLYVSHPVVGWSTSSTSGFFSCNVILWTCMYKSILISISYNIDFYLVFQLLIF